MMFPGQWLSRWRVQLQDKMRWFGSARLGSARLGAARLGSARLGFGQLFDARYGGPANAYRTLPYVSVAQKG